VRKNYMLDCALKARSIQEPIHEMANCDDPCTADLWPWECDCDAPDIGRMDDFEWPPMIVVIVGSLLLIAYVVYLVTMHGRHKKVD